MKKRFLIILFLLLLLIGCNKKEEIKESKETITIKHSDGRIKW